MNDISVNEYWGTDREKNLIIYRDVKAYVFVRFRLWISFCPAQLSFTIRIVDLSTVALC
jgi:hypothetical protein